MTVALEVLDEPGRNCRTTHAMVSRWLETTGHVNSEGVPASARKGSTCIRQVLVDGGAAVHEAHQLT